MNDLTLPDNPTASQLQTLLDDWRWLGELSRQIIRDPAVADDAVQSVWLAAHTRGVGTLKRAHMIWALRQFVSGTRLADARRRRREALASRQAVAPSTSELIERGEQQQRVWRALRDLADPPRTSMLLHYQDGLTPNEIAAQSGLRPDSVRNHLRKGVALLRERLSVDDGAGGLLALALAVPPGDAQSVSRAGRAAASNGLASTAGGPVGSYGVLVVGAVVATVLILALSARSSAPEQQSSDATHGRAIPDVAHQAAASTNDGVDNSHLATVPEWNGLATPIDVSVSHPDTEEEPPEVTVHHFAGEVQLEDGAGSPVQAPVSGLLAVTISTRQSSKAFSVAVEDDRFDLALSIQRDGTWTGPQGRPIWPWHTHPIDAAEISFRIQGVHMHGAAIAVPRRQNQTGIFQRADYRLVSCPLVVHLVEVLPIRLAIVDRNGPGQHLTGLEVRRSSRSVNYPYPGEDTTVLATGASSPFVIRPTLSEARSSEVRYFARAPGYAWGSLVVPFPNGQERTLALDRSGSLEVTVVGRLPANALLTISQLPQQRTLAVVTIPKSQTVLLEHLPTGDYECSLVLGDVHAIQPKTQPTEQVTIQPQSTAHVTVVVASSEAAVTVSLEGRFHKGGEWEQASPILRIVRTSPATGSQHERATIPLLPMYAVDGDPNAFDFKVPQLVPGDYHAALLGVPYPIPFHLPPGGATGIELRLPAPVKVLATVRDSKTLEVDSGASAASWWGRDFNTGIYGGSSPGPTPGTVELIVPAGQVTLEANGDRLCTGIPITVDAREGLTVDLFVEQRAAAEVRLGCDGETILWPEDFPFEPVRLDGRNVESSWGGGTGYMIIYSADEGRYRLPLPPLAGFQAVPPIEFEMRLGEAVELEVNYTKTPR